MENSKFKSFKEARAYVHSLNIKSTEEWRAYRKSKKRPADIPSDPRSVYFKKGWKGYSDWLGNGKKPYKFPKEKFDYIIEIEIS